MVTSVGSLFKVLVDALKGLVGAFAGRRYGTVVLGIFALIAIASIVLAVKDGEYGLLYACASFLVVLFVVSCVFELRAKRLEKSAEPLFTRPNIYDLKRSGESDEEFRLRVLHEIRKQQNR